MWFVHAKYVYIFLCMFITFDWNYWQNWLKQVSIFAKLLNYDVTKLQYISNILYRRWNIEISCFEKNRVDNSIY